MNPKLYIDAILPHLGAIIGLGLGFVLIARLMRERRRPSNTFAWLVLILMAPYIGVPLYLLIGGRKIARLTKNKKKIDFKNALNANNHSSLSPFGIVSQHNSTQFLDTGTDGFYTLVNSIQEAKHTIDVTTFILSHDAIGRRVVRELAAKARAGIKVRLLLDAVGSWGKKTFYMLELEKAGGRIERFMPVFPIAFPGAANLRNHRKIAIFDGAKAIIGGRNIGRDYMGPTKSTRRWKDLGVIIEGPAVVALNSIFEDDWKFASRKRNYTPQKSHVPLPGECGDSEIEIMASGPDTIGDPLYEKILSVIQEAKTSITIVTPYYIPDDVLQRSLIVKARTGKSVTVILPRRSNHGITDLARKHYLRELHAANVNILYYRAGMLHGKALLIDERIAMTGSANMDLRSLFANYEVAAFFYSEKDIERTKKWIQEIEKDSSPITGSEIAPRGMLKSIAEDLCRMIAPLL